MSALPEQILVLEDDPKFQKVLEFWLSEEGFHVTIAENSIDALCYARKLQFDLVISDYHLPDYLGTDFVQLLRRIPSYNCIPVIFVTARVELEREWLRRELGALVLYKPFKMTLLCETVCKCLSIVRDSDASERSQLV